MVEIIVNKISFSFKISLELRTYNSVPCILLFIFITVAHYFCCFLGWTIFLDCQPQNAEITVGCREQKRRQELFDVDIMRIFLSDIPR